MTRKVLIAGIKGYVGSLLFKRLGKLESCDVFGMYKSEGKYFIEAFRDQKQIQFDDLCDASVHIESIGIESIVNLVASTKKDSSPLTAKTLIESNCSFGTVLASVAAEASVERFIHVSTFSTSINSQNYFPQTLYAATKKAAEEILVYFAQSENMKVTIISPYDIYGPKQPHKRLIPTLIQGLLRQEPIKMSGGGQPICPIYIDDVLDGLQQSVTRIQENPLEKFSLAGTEVFAVKDLPDLISRHLMINWRSGLIEFDSNYRKNEYLRFFLKDPVLEDWHPQVSFLEGVRKVAGSMVSA